MSDERLVGDWCFELGLDIDDISWLGSGDFGTAYSLPEGNVIKITTDKNEFISTFNLLKNKSDHLPSIYGMRVFPNGELGILMEELDTGGIDDLFSRYKLEIEKQDADYSTVEVSDLMDDELAKFVTDIEASMHEMRKLGVGNFDIHDGNIGLNSHGNYVLFDQTKKGGFEPDELEFEMIKKKLKGEYFIDTPILKEDVPIDRILAREKSMYRSLNNISVGKVSKTTAPLECIYNKDGNLQLTDGHHRFCESLLKGEDTVSVLVVMDERTGYLNPTYAHISEDEALEICESLTYGGLEAFACEVTLEDYLEDYLNRELKEDFSFLDKINGVVEKENKGEKVEGGGFIVKPEKPKIQY